MVLTKGEALIQAQAVARLDGLLFSLHAIERMQERLASQADVTMAVLTADVAVPSEDGPNRWVLCGGRDVDDCGLKVVVAIDEDDVVTVTVVTAYP